MVSLRRNGGTVRCFLAAAGVVLVGLAGCAGRPSTEDVGPGVIFNSVMAGDVGGELKIVFPDYSREPAVEHGREESEAFMVEVRPVWSPDGQKLAFTRTEEGIEETLYVRTSLGHPEAESRRIGPAAGVPVWSPASDSIAYLAMEPNGEPEGEGKAKAEEARPAGLTVVSDDGSDERLLVSGEAEPVGWSEADGIYYTYGIYGLRTLRVMNPEDKKSRLVYRAPRGRFVGEVALAPGSRYLAFEVASLDDGSVLMIRNLRSGATRQVTAGSVSDFAWSPNGDKVAFVQGGVVGKARRIMVAGASTGRTTVLTADRGKYSSPTWSPDGKRIGYVLDGKIYVQESRRGRPTLVGGTGDAAAVVWSPK